MCPFMVLYVFSFLPLRIKVHANYLTNPTFLRVCYIVKPSDGLSWENFLLKCMIYCGSVSGVGEVFGKIFQESLSFAWFTPRFSRGF